MIVSGAGGGYGPLAQFPRCSPPLIRIFGGREPVPVCSASVQTLPLFSLLPLMAD
jgi:hypothetical protein